jgi:hypothetical protein
VNALDLLMAQLGNGGVDMTPQPQKDDWTQYRRQPWGVPPSGPPEIPGVVRRGVQPGEGGLIMNPAEFPNSERGPGPGPPVELSGGMAWDRSLGGRQPLGMQGAARIPLPLAGDPTLELSGGYQMPFRGQKMPWNARLGLRIPF